MANTFTNPTFVKAKPHASAEKQVGDSDPSARTDVINRVEKGLLAVLKRLFNTITDGVTADFTDQTTITEFANAPIVPRAVSGTPAQHGLFRENVVKAYGTISGGGTPVLDDSFNITSIGDTGTGDVTVTLDRDFANTTYTVLVCQSAEATQAYPAVSTKAVGSFHIVSENTAGASVDGSGLDFVCIGDQ